MTITACPICHKRFATPESADHHLRDKHGKRLTRELRAAEPDAVSCIECGQSAVLVKGDKIYPHRPDLYVKNFWLCECGAYCGCHGVTTRALGSPCGPETRRSRMAAHDAFDPLWQSREMTRREAYDWLSDCMGIAADLTHIGMFSRAQAMEVVRHCRERRGRAA